MATRRTKVTRKAVDGFAPPPTISRSEFIRDGSDAGFREAIYSVVQGYGRLLMCRDVFARAAGMTPTQFVVLMGVAHRQGASGIAIKDLAERVALASTHVTTEVGRLARKGLLAKRQDEADKRSVLVSLTPAGETEVVRISPLVRRVNDMLFQDIKAAELEAAEQVARQLALNWRSVEAEFL